jgi:hypothetical protein
MRLMCDCFNVLLLAWLVKGTDMAAKNGLEHCTRALHNAHTTAHGLRRPYWQWLIVSSHQLTQSSDIVLGGSTFILSPFPSTQLYTVTFWRSKTN